MWYMISVETGTRIYGPNNSKSGKIRGMSLCTVRRQRNQPLIYCYPVSAELCQSLTNVWNLKKLKSSVHCFYRILCNSKWHRRETLHIVEQKKPIKKNPNKHFCLAPAFFFFFCSSFQRLLEKTFLFFIKLIPNCIRVSVCGKKRKAVALQTVGDVPLLSWTWAFSFTYFVGALQLFCAYPQLAVTTGRFLVDGGACFIWIRQWWLLRSRSEKRESLRYLFEARQSPCWIISWGT